MAISEIWNHYSEGILKARVPYTEISTKRGNRFIGHSQMNFVSLVMHGLSAISVHADTIGVRALIAALLLVLASIIAIVIVVFIRVATNLAIPGWASYVTASFFVILMQAVMISLFFIFMVLNNRSNPNFLLLRDYPYFVLRLRKLLAIHDGSKIKNSSSREIEVPHAFV
jgi:hypothetical protein